MTDLLRAVLTDVAADVDEVGIDRSGSAAHAWAGARRQRRRRVAGVGAAVAALAVAGPLAVSRVQAPRTDLPATTPTLSSSTGSPNPSAPVVMVEGVTVDTLPAARIGSLPRLALNVDGAPLPTRLRVDREDVLPVLGSGVGTSGRVGAVLVRDLGGGQFHPVFFVGGSVGGYREATGVTLTPFGSLVNGKRMVLGAHIVAPDGYRVGFVQDGAVVFVDIRDGSVRRVAVPSDHLEGGGWSAGGTSFIARSDTAQWRIDPSTSTVQPVAADTGDGQALVASLGQTAQLRHYGADGSVTDARPVSAVLGQPWADTATSQGGLVATGVFTAPSVSSTVDGFQGMSFLGFDEDGSFQRLRTLVLTGLPDAPKGAFTALGWVSEAVVLYRLATHDAVRLMAWDIVQGRSWVVADLPSDDLGQRMTLGVGVRATAEPP